MGEVYKALDTRLDRIVAIKVSKTEFSERFDREAKAIAALNHPHICQVHDVGPDYLVMEHIEGEPLKGPLPLAKALEYAGQIAGALDAAHTWKITHRDLKPANILVTPSSGVKLLDFGLAKVEKPVGPDEETVTKGFTGEGQILGTLLYMSPEQAQGKQVDARSDIFSFGLVLYEMITGKRAFNGANPPSIIAAILERPAPSISDVAPATLDRVLQRCLEKDREDRWQSARDLKAALELVSQADEEAGVVAQSAARRRWLWPGVAGVLALGGLGLWVPSRPPPPVDRPLLQFSVDLGPESVPGPRTTAVLSPDGTRVVFPSRGPDGRTRLSIRLLNQPKATPLPGTENGTDPFFSPDGHWIGFFTDNKIKKIAVAGGAVVTLCDSADGRGASWGQDSNIITAWLSGGLFRVPEGGGTPEPLTDPTDKGETHHRWPQVLPGGNSVLFTANTSAAAWDGASIAILSLKSGQWKTVLRGGYFARYLPSGHLVYIHQGVMFGVPFDPDRGELHGTPAPLLEEVATHRFAGSGQFSFSQTGTLVYSSGKYLGTYPTAWMDAAGKTQPLLAPGEYFTPRLSPDGRRLAISSSASETAGLDVFVYDIPRDNMTRITFSGLNSRPVWAPNGEHIVYSSGTGAGSILMWARADGASEPKTLIQSKAGLDPYSFSPDGKRLAYNTVGNKTSGDLWTLPLDITDPDRPKPGKAELFLGTPASELNPAFSPDGRWIAYQSSAGSTSTEIYVVPFPGPGGNWQVSSGGGRLPVWSRDGRELLYETPDNHIMAAAFTAKGNSFVREKVRQWSSQPILWSAMRNFDLSPDGKRLVMFPLPQTSEANNPSVHVTFLLNFFDELQRRMPAK